MSSIPLELPLKASEAAAVADVVFQVADGHELSDDVRARLGVRASAIGLTTLRACWGSLQRDPVHAGTYYLAVDALAGDNVTPLLLRIALATAPASGLFPHALLIGRMRPGGGREVVVNAIPFAPDDLAAIRTYAERVDPSFLPRPQGPQPAIIVGGDGLELSAAFDAFRRILKATGVNLAAIAPRPLEAGLWAAIRTGWREGFNAEAETVVAGTGSPEDLERAGEQIARSARYSKFVVDATHLLEHGVEDGACLSVCAQLYDSIRSARSAAGTGPAFDFEVIAGGVTPLEMAQILQSLKSGGRAAQMIGVPFDPDLAVRMAEVARSMNATMCFDASRLSQQQIADAAALGRTGFRLEQATAESIEWLAGLFRG